MGCFIDVSLKLLEDLDGQRRGRGRFDVAQEFGRMEGEVFIDGNGVKPLGFLSESGTAYTATGNASTLGSAPADLLITPLQHAGDLPEPRQLDDERQHPRGDP